MKSTNTFSCGYVIKCFGDSALHIHAIYSSNCFYVWRNFRVDSVVVHYLFLLYLSRLGELLVIIMKTTVPSLCLLIIVGFST